MILERIMDALKTIQETCDEQGSCERCPLGASIDGKCLVNEIEPSEWELVNLTHERRRMMELISREDVLKLLNEICIHALKLYDKKYHLPIRTMTSTAVEDIKKLPSQWVEINEPPFGDEDRVTGGANDDTV